MGGYYDTALGNCVYHPPIQYICEYGTYDASSGVCEYEPPVEAQCPDGTTWNSVSGMCESYPESQIICEPFYAYDATLDACVRHVESVDQCIDGEYDEVQGICVMDLPTTVACPDGAFLSDDLSSCIYYPAVENQCISGGIYDDASGTCVIVPDYDYVCFNGELITLSTGELACEIDTGIYVCPAGFYWDGELCMEEGSVITGGACASDSDCDFECASGETIYGECTNNVCLIDTGECPETAPEGIWEIAVSWMRWIIDNIFVFIELSDMN